MANTNTAVKIETAMEKITRLEAENAALTAKIEKQHTPGKVTCKVTKARAAGTNGPTDQGTTSTGAISMYGLNRFPVTLRRKQWMRVKEYLFSAEFQAFVAEHEAELVDEK